MVQASGEGSNESSGRVPTVEDFDGNLAAVGVSGEAEFDAQFRGPVETVGIVREQDVGDVVTDKSVYEVGFPPFVRRAEALVMNNPTREYHRMFKRFFADYFAGRVPTLVDPFVAP